MIEADSTMLFIATSMLLILNVHGQSTTTHREVCETVGDLQKIHNDIAELRQLILNRSPSDPTDVTGEEIMSLPEIKRNYHSVDQTAHRPHLRY